MLLIQQRTKETRPGSFVPEAADPVVWRAYGQISLGACCARYVGADSENARGRAMWSSAVLRKIQEVEPHPLTRERNIAQRMNEWMPVAHSSKENFRRVLSYKPQRGKSVGRKCYSGLRNNISEEEIASFMTVVPNVCSLNSLSLSNKLMGHQKVPLEEETSSSTYIPPEGSGMVRTKRQ